MINEIDKQYSLIGKFKTIFKSEIHNLLVFPIPSNEKYLCYLIL